jgi:CBS domain-containing protein
MTTDVVALDPNDTLHQAAQQLTRNDISGAPVMRDDKVIGILSESDILSELSSGAPVSSGFSWFDAVALMLIERYPHPIASRKVSDIMTTHPATVPPDANIEQAAAIMHRERVKRLPVINDLGQMEGIVSRGDLVRAMAKDDADIRKDVLGSLDVLGDEVFAGLDVNVDEGVATIAGIADRRSTRDIAIRMASRTPGVVQVRDRLEYEFDDSHLVTAAGSGRLEQRRNWNDGLDVGDPAR